MLSDLEISARDLPLWARASREGCRGQPPRQLHVADTPHARATSSSKRTSPSRPIAWRRLAISASYTRSLSTANKQVIKEYHSIYVRPSRKATSLSGFSGVCETHSGRASSCDSIANSKRFKVRLGRTVFPVLTYTIALQSPTSLSKPVELSVSTRSACATCTLTTIYSRRLTRAPLPRTALPLAIEHRITRDARLPTASCRSGTKLIYFFVE